MNAHPTKAPTVRVHLTRLQQFRDSQPTKCAGYFITQYFQPTNQSYFSTSKTLEEALSAVVGCSRLGQRAGYIFDPGKDAVYSPDGTHSATIRHQLNAWKQYHQAVAYNEKVDKLVQSYEEFPHLFEKPFYRPVKLTLLTEAPNSKLLVELQPVAGT